MTLFEIRHMTEHDTAHQVKQILTFLSIMLLAMLPIILSPQGVRAQNGTADPANRGTVLAIVSGSARQPEPTRFIQTLEQELALRGLNLRSVQHDFANLGSEDEIEDFFATLSEHFAEKPAGIVLCGEHSVAFYRKFADSPQMASNAVFAMLNVEDAPKEMSGTLCDPHAPAIAAETAFSRHKDTGLFIVFTDETERGRETREATRAILEQQHGAEVVFPGFEQGRQGAISLVEAKDIARQAPSGSAIIFQGLYTDAAYNPAEFVADAIMYSQAPVTTLVQPNHATADALISPNPEEHARIIARMIAAPGSSGPEQMVIASRVSVLKRQVMKDVPTLRDRVPEFILGTGLLMAIVAGILAFRARKRPDARNQ